MCKDKLNILSLNAEGMIPEMYEIKHPELNATEYVIANDENVVYIQCPHCLTGYVAKLVSITADTERHIVYQLLVNTGNGVIDLCNEQHCFTCDRDYIPVKQSRVIRTDEFAMEKLMKTKVK